MPKPRRYVDFNIVFTPKLSFCMENQVRKPNSKTRVKEVQGNHYTRFPFVMSFVLFFKQKEKKRKKNCSKFFVYDFQTND